ncbi:hypothetical protein AGMMS49975_22740 [Clostridia bacterium]|nr:hypothetical protein AGMMS49975_22740 [Clostridia bacterium]
MTITERDGGLWVDLFWDDLSETTQAELLNLMGDNGNFDVYPLASINVSPAEEQQQPQDGGVTIIALERKEDNWVSGSCGRYKFEAKVYDAGSKHGINGGRVSKLSIWRTENGVKIEVVCYERGWDKKPANDYDFAVFSAILACLEQLPKENGEGSE